ncbi:adenosylcobinamide-GDP ribazoletransferase [Gordonia paraffinivorans]|uniref:adenosylcobinamide-GDP ribazoletransferase n=1 Tax=Gordonia paraffinivorans TaxID=175628 RepID=UPI00243188F5|nr:adenosylcobinamide-GDP ribazoletransferase [Gordonia paraffinivorans]
MISPVRAVRTALGWMTVVPVGAGGEETPDRELGGAVLAALPVVGALLGAAAVGIAYGLGHTGLPIALIGVLVVAALAVLTRGMHLDGLADTADGLGCYGPPDRVAEVMRSGTVGPFGVATLVLTLGVQATGIAGLAAGSRWYELAFAVALGRLGAVIGARRALGPAHPDGFGALVAGTQQTSIPVWLAVFAVATLPMGWDGDGVDVTGLVQGWLVLAAVAGFGLLFTRHCARRMGGVTGDVLGATIELCVAIAVVGLLL